MAHHVFAPLSTLMPGIIPASRMALTKGVPSFLFLPNCLVVEDYSADAIPQTGRGDNPLPIGAPGFFRLGNPQLGKSRVAGRGAFIHRQQTFIAGGPAYAQWP